MAYLYHLLDSTQNVPEASDEWEQELKDKSIICSSCRTILKRQPVDIYLKGKMLKSYAPITVARGSGISMIRKDILSDMGEALLHEDCHIGKVYDCNGKEAADHISFVSKTEPIQIRGDETSTQNHCTTCGKFLYFPLPLNQWYVVANQVPNKPYIPDSFMGLLCTAELAKSLRAKGYQKIGYCKIAVLPSSTDGYDSEFV